MAKRKIYLDKVPPITTGGAMPIKNIDVNKVKDTIYKSAYEYATEGLPLDTIRQRLFKNLIYAYNPGSPIEALKRIRNAVVDNNAESTDVTFNFLSPVTYSKKSRDMLSDIAKEQADMQKKTYGNLFAQYLNIPREQWYAGEDYNKGVVESEYKPTKGSDKQYYKLVFNPNNPAGQYLNKMNFFSDYDFNDERRLVNAIFNGESEGYRNPIDRGGAPSTKHGFVPIGKNVLSEVLGTYGLGTHTIGHGADPYRGEYVSYYDLWDMAPSSMGGKDDESMGIGKPIPIYDRIYLNDYYGVPTEKTLPKYGDYYGGYIPEVIVSGDRRHKFLGGRINRFKYGGKVPPVKNAVEKQDAVVSSNSVIPPNKPNVWNTIDTYANYADAGLGLAQIGTGLASVIAPNEYTIGANKIASLLGAGVDLYQGGRALYNKDYLNAFLQGLEAAVTYSGMKMLTNAPKYLEKAGATDKIRRYVGRGKRRHSYLTTKGEAQMRDAQATGAGLYIVGNALPMRVFSGGSR